MKSNSKPNSCPYICEKNKNDFFGKIEIVSHVLLGKIFEAIGFELLPTIDEDLGLGDLSHPLCHDHCRHISKHLSQIPAVESI